MGTSLDQALMLELTYRLQSRHLEYVQRTKGSHAERKDGDNVPLLRVSVERSRVSKKSVKSQYKKHNTWTKSTKTAQWI